jgi:hypothetical protein
MPPRETNYIDSHALMLKLLKSRSDKSNIKVTRSNLLVHTETKDVKYQSPSTYYSKGIGMVKVFNM